MSLMEKFMLKAHELQAQGFTQKQIAEQLGRSERTIRTWLKQTPECLTHASRQEWTAQLC